MDAMRIRPNPRHRVQHAQGKIGHGYGVSARTNYALDRIWSLDSVADNLVPEPKCLQQMPFRP
jgi:hypothetical protein